MPRGVKKEHKDPAGRPAIARGIPAKVVDALLNCLGVDEEQITEDSKLVEDLGADSLDLVELQVLFEDELHLKDGVLDDETAERWASGGTVRDLIADLRAHGAKV